MGRIFVKDKEGDVLQDMKLLQEGVESFKGCHDIWVQRKPPKLSIQFTLDFEMISSHLEMPFSVVTTVDPNQRPKKVMMN